MRQVWGILVPGLVLLAAVVIAQEPPPADITGHWKLNLAQSDDAHQKMKEARAAHAQAAQGSHPEGDHDESAEAAQPAGNGFFNPPNELTVKQTADGITIFVKDGAIRVLHPDGKRRRASTSFVTTHWEQNALVVYIEPDKAAKRTQTFTISEDKRQFFEVVRLESAFGPVSIRRVYDAVPE
jgi:hypothetical protein